MTFVQPEFVALMLTVFVIYWALPSRALQNVLLVIASAIFYGWVHPWFLFLLAFSAILDYSVGLAMVSMPERRKLLLMASLGGNLGMLAYFKYYDFFVENVVAALGSLGMNASVHTLGVILPVGISFYTFQTLSYTIDVYRGQLQPRRDFLDYLVYVCFFPQLVAGPIERAGNLLPQVETERRFELERVLSGFGLAMWGAFKKVCIADTVAPYVDQVHMLKEPSAALVWAAVVGFGVQILADFSGYTDLARGTARMLGFELVKNFDRPYLATSTPDFWRRWHMSLSTWIGDYVYVPLARSGRSSGGRIAMALMVTFFLIGLWHGAAWTFIALGLWHGMWMVIYTLGTPLLPRSVRQFSWGRPLAILFHTVVVLGPGGLLFRETSIERVLQHLSQPLFGSSKDELVAAAVVLGVSIAAAIPMMLAVLVEDHVIPRINKSSFYLPIQSTLWAAEAVAILVFYRVTVNDFIYFQF